MRAEELLELRATIGLEPDEERELVALGVADDVSFDLAAASISIATLDVVDEMPAALSAKILLELPGASDTTVMPAMRMSGLVQDSTAERTRLGVGAYAPPVASAPASSPVQPTKTPDVIPIDVARFKRRAAIASTVAALGLAAAAAAVIYVQTRAPIVKTIAENPKQVQSPSEQRAALLANAKDVTTIAWTATKDANAVGATGDVVWSASAQQGFMRFKGLAANDAKQIQYQLWIFDADRPEATPVDGGVFDVASTGEVVVPISAKLAVGKPTLFAVTVERPGGVVVSKRERIVVTAALPS
jgi:type II secretory pathway component PulM